VWWDPSLFLVDSAMKEPESLQKEKKENVIGDRKKNAGDLSQLETSSGNHGEKKSEGSDRGQKTKFEIAEGGGGRRGEPYAHQLRNLFVGSLRKSEDKSNFNRRV